MITITRDNCPLCCCNYLKCGRCESLSDFAPDGDFEYRLESRMEEKMRKFAERYGVVVRIIKKGVFGEKRD